MKSKYEVDAAISELCLECLMASSKLLDLAGLTDEEREAVEVAHLATLSLIAGIVNYAGDRVEADTREREQLARALRSVHPHGEDN